MENKIVKFNVKKPHSLSKREKDLLFLNAVKTLTHFERKNVLFQKNKVLIIVLPEIYKNIQNNVIEYVFSQECEKSKEQFDIALVNILNLIAFEKDGKTWYAYENENAFVSLRKKTIF